MTKETITLEAIKQDLMITAVCQILNKEEWRFTYIIPITLISVLVWIYWQSLWISILVFSVAAYHIVCYAKERKEHNAKKRAIKALIERGEISISVEQLSHIADETIYEPHVSGRRARSLKTIKKYYFHSSASWREPDVMKHYRWSHDFCLSPKGLDNISISGDDFYFVSLQGSREVSYIYPCKFFTLDCSLERYE